jgi:hypothetical protein
LELIPKWSSKAREIEPVKKIYAKSVTMHKIMNVAAAIVDIVEVKQHIAKWYASNLPKAEPAKDTFSLIAPPQRAKRRGRAWKTLATPGHISITTLKAGAG